MYFICRVLLFASSEYIHVLCKQLMCILSSSAGNGWYQKHSCSICKTKGRGRRREREEDVKAIGEVKERRWDRGEARGRRTDGKRRQNETLRREEVGQIYSSVKLLLVVTYGNKMWHQYWWTNIIWPFDKKLSSAQIIQTPFPWVKQVQVTLLY